MFPFDILPSGDRPMKYLCMIHYDEAVIDTMPARELEALVADSNAYDELLKQRGQLVVAHALQPVKAARVVQLRHGKPSHTDGPFVEAREQLGGFVLVEAQDLNAAIQIAAQIPMARYGAVEVRAIARIERVAP
jgi:hypothetical protein